MGRLGPFLALSTIAASATVAPNALPQCPAFPDPTTVSSEAVLQDSRVVAALAEVDRLLRSAASQLPSGLVATVVLGQSTAWTKGYGSRNVSDPAAGPPTGTDLVRIASISKVFTSLLLFVLRDQGLLQLDDPLEAWLPSFSIGTAGAWTSRERVTLRMLASHTGGLPRETPYPCADFSMPYDPAHCNETVVLGLLARQAAVIPPNLRFHYSNLGMALLGRALGHAAATGKTWDPLAYEQAMEDLVFAPLGMVRACFWGMLLHARPRACFHGRRFGRQPSPLAATVDFRARQCMCIHTSWRISLSVHDLALHPTSQPQPPWRCFVAPP